MLANSASARDIKHVLHGYVELATHRVQGSTVITGGRGVFVFDENGTLTSKARPACGAPHSASASRSWSKPPSSSSVSCPTITRSPTSR